MDGLKAEELLRATGVNVCDGEQSLLIHASWNDEWVIPQFAADFVWPSGNPSIGCNALCCGFCGKRLRNMPNFRLAYGSGADACAQLFDLADWSSAAAAGIAVPSAGSRSYVCRCSGIDLSFLRQLRAGSHWSIADDNPGPPGWHCGGHPRLQLPTVLDGLALSADSFSAQSVAAILRGEVPSTRPLWLGPQPAEWLLRLFYLLDDRGLAARLVAVVADFLAPDCPEVAAALGFFAGVPIAAAEVARPPLAKNFAVLPADFPERLAPFVPHPRVERLLRRLESHLADSQ